MIGMTLYRCEVNRPFYNRDNLGIWFFWQKAFPYRLGGVPESRIIDVESRCEVYVIGGRDLVFEGFLKDVPPSLRSYLHEVRILDSSLAL
jgi:hypothetical protein